MFSGVYTALVTPFSKGKLDEAALKKLIELQVKGGVDGIVPVGTTGESPTVDFEEHVRLVELSVYYAKGRCKIIAGSGANSTEEAVYLTKSAEYAGADGSLQVCPYYNKPSQAGLYAHFSEIANSTNLPIVLYSIPSRCNVELEVSTVMRLAADYPNIVCIKEAGGSGLKEDGIFNNAYIVAKDSSEASREWIVEFNKSFIAYYEGTSPAGRTAQFLGGFMDEKHPCGISNRAIFYRHFHC